MFNFLAWLGIKLGGKSGLAGRDLLKWGKLRVYFYWPVNYSRRSWVLTFQWGKGAGYIGGWTFYIAWRMVHPDYHWNQGHRYFLGARLVQVGWTRNGNRTPSSAAPGEWWQCTWPWRVWYDWRVYRPWLKRDLAGDE